MVVKLSTFLSSSLAEGLDSALVTGIIANTDVALDSGTSGNYVAQITGGDGIIALNASAHEATAEIKVDSASIPTNTNVATLTNKTFNLTNNTLTGTLGQFNAALNGSTFVSLDGGETLTNKTLTSPTINTPQIVGPGSFSKVTTLGLRDQTTNAYDLRVFSNSSTALTDNRTLTFDTENVNRTVKLGGDLIIDKELRTAGNFNLLMNLADSTNITLPTSGTVMQFDSNGASSITGAFTAGSLAGHYLGADSDVTELVTKTFVDALNVDAETLGGRDSDYFLNYNNFTNTPAGSVALASLGVSPPSSPSNGQIWWDDSAGNLYIYYVDSEGDTQWVEAVPQLAAQDFLATSGGAVNGDVTIGDTAAARSRLDVKVSSTTAYSTLSEPREDLIVQNMNGTDNTGVDHYATIGMAVANGATSQGFINYVRTGNNTGKFTFIQRINASDYEEHLTLDQNGILINPQLPLVSGTAIRDTNGGHLSNANVDTGYNLYLNDIHASNGGHWNNSTGVWTCPVGGKYFVHASFLVDDDHTSGSLARYAWRQNGTEKYKSYNHDKYGSTYGGQHCAGGILNCSANDTITIQATNGLWHSGGESGFSIHFLG